MQESTSTATTEHSCRSEAPEHDENEVTQPHRIISSRTPHSGVPVKPRGSWFKKHEQPDVRRTPDFTEIGDPAA